jgi:CheY-like chemotaxis protein
LGTYLRGLVFPGMLAALKATPPILIAEDSDDDFFFFRRAVRATPIENPILRFRDGAECVKFIEGLSVKPSADDPWLLFVDISMPIMNGFDLLRWVRDHRDLHLVPIVLSGSNRDEDRAQAEQLGAQDFLVKPLSGADLTRVAMRLLKTADAC